ncbi:MAG: hypothetical protein D6722_29055 [Bacteroidetes bacterium]|nr:MAG: hypothetical protein D6722_29055 [Bacteroidota bacterium]
MIARLLYTAFGLLFLAILAFVVWIYRDDKRIRRQFHQALDQLETDYKNFLRRQAVIPHSTEASTEQQLDQLTHEALVLLKTEMETLLTLVENRRGTYVNLKYDGRMFSLLAGKLESYLLKESKSEVIPLKPQEREALYAVLTDIIRSDLQDHILSWRAGEVL